MFEPTYPMLAHAASLAGTEVTRTWAGPEYRVDPELFPGHRLIFLARPNNPTGQAVDESLIHRALAEPAMVFLDEATEHDGFTGFGDKIHAHHAILIHGHGFFARVKIAIVHVRHMGSRCLAPPGHRMGIFPRVTFNSGWRTPVGVAFA